MRPLGKTSKRRASRVLAGQYALIIYGQLHEEFTT